MPAREEQMAPKVPRRPSEVNMPGMLFSRARDLVLLYLETNQIARMISAVRIIAFHQFAHGRRASKKSRILFRIYLLATYTVD